MDFTLIIYQQLLNALQKQGYSFQTLSEFILSPKSKALVLRHDVDKLPQNSLRFARIQARLGIKGTYYFRMVPESWDEAIIKEIGALRHEVGYHYETMDTAFSAIKSNEHETWSMENNEELLDLAFEEFCVHLAELRKLVPVSTVCMHGSPRSRFDNKDIWKKYDYRQLDIIGEPYYDVDFNQVLYLTDTGRRWDGWKTSFRDKVPQQQEWVKQGLVFHSTEDIFKAIEEKRFPDRVLFTFHPQRWNDAFLPWMKELVLQNVKNVVKRLIINR